MTVRTSVIIPTYNHLDDCLRPCLESLIQYTDLSDKEVIVVANGCTDGTLDYVNGLSRQHPEIRLIFLEQALGFAKPVNIGIRAARGDRIVILNNDTVFSAQPIDEWARMLLDPLDDPQVGITGPVALHDPQFKRSFLIFFCVGTRRDVIDKVGLLDEVFVCGGGEDQDYCLRAMDLGYKLVRVPVGSEPFLSNPNDFGDGIARWVSRFPLWHVGEATVKQIPNWEQIFHANMNYVRTRHIRVNIVMPVYNESKLIGDAVRAVLAQTYPDWHLWIVDDCSTDGTADVLRGFDDPRITVLRMDKNSGVCAARNTALDRIEYGYTAYCDADDVWDADHLANALDAFDLDTYMVYTDCRKTFDDGEPAAMIGINHYEVFPEGQSRLKHENFIFISTVVHKTLPKIDPFDARLNSIEDWDRWAMIEERGLKIKHLCKQDVTYRIKRGGSNAGQCNAIVRSIFAEKHGLSLPAQQVKDSFRVADKYRHYIKGPMLEIGSDRFEGSTGYFAEIAKSLNVPLWSVDCEHGAYQRAAKILHGNAFHMKGEEFIQHVLPTLNAKLSFVFLDNYDFIVKTSRPDWYDYERKIYLNMGMQFSNEESQRVHLEQTQLLQPYLADDALIGFDDTWRKPDGTFDGKGGLAVPWLLEQGYTIVEQGQVGEDVVCGYVLMSRLDMRLRVRVITCTKNEEAILPFFLQYYATVANEIVIFDGGSTDRTLEIADRFAHENPVVVRIFQRNEEQLDERNLMTVRNEAYKTDRASFDWQIVVDADEFIYHPNLLEKLREYKLRGVTVPRILGYEMVSREFPKLNGVPLTDQVTTGFHNREWQSKLAVFNPAKVNINYETGCHKANPTGDVVYSENAELKLLHYRELGYAYFVDKSQYISNRLSDYNKAHDFGYHTTMYAKLTQQEFEEHVRKSYNIKSLKLNLGCGAQIRPDYVNIDLYAPEANLKCDVAVLPFEDGEVDEILAEHIIEHFDFHQAFAVLREWNRVLKPGGKLVLETPDLMASCKRFVTADNDLQIKLYGHMFAMPWEPGNTHKFLYTEQQLGWTLGETGFANIARIPPASGYVIAGLEDIHLRVQCNKVVQK